MPVMTFLVKSLGHDFLLGSFEKRFWKKAQYLDCGPMRLRMRLDNKRIQQKQLQSLLIGQLAGL